jgi:hypothetical protein
VLLVHKNLCKVKNKNHFFFFFFHFFLITQKLYFSTQSQTNSKSFQNFKNSLFEITLKNRDFKARILFIEKALYFNFF